jgi:hypothetical protein
VEFLGQVVFGIVLALIAASAVAVPAFLAGGLVGLFIRRFVAPTRRLGNSVIGAWMLLCAGGAGTVIVQTETAAHHGALDGLGEMIVAFIGVAFAIGGAYALHWTLRLGRTGSSC